MFESFFSRFAPAFPKVKADDDAEEEELVDPQQVLRKPSTKLPGKKLSMKTNLSNPKENETPSIQNVTENKPPAEEPQPQTLNKTPRVSKIPTSLRSKSKSITNESIVNVANTAEDVVDPLDTLREQCREGHHAKELAEKYQACNDRVNSRSQTTETCVEELFDLLHAIDHCVTEKLFKQLK